MISMDEELALRILKGPHNQAKDRLSIKKKLTPYYTYSRNVFLPLTHVCRNACGYCIFRKNVNQQNNILKKEKVYQMLEKAELCQCTEALFTFGEKPEVYPEIERELKEMGYTTIIEYLRDLCEYTVDKTMLFPHSNPGVLTKEDLITLKPVNASMGLMLETVSERLTKTEAHMYSPGKHPALRLKTIEMAGELHIPFTTGILVGIGETDREIYESLQAIRNVQDRYGHIQEVIIQNFQPKPGTVMQHFNPVPVLKMAAIIVLARHVFPDTPLQVPPNLNRDALELLLQCGADDLGGVSPVTPDYVNPKYEWPNICELSLQLRERLPVYPKFIHRKYLSPSIYEKAVSVTDEEGYVRRFNEH
ncbi:MAG: 7,8-didemethyl-8-hydroxy-5-deazariboflavin synthase subunit CofG [Theionarchaea archaeon]|nr:7,8-didemethyl-8-hydroxy-5-deazariboflavin synthase subunit CofG [Theionarchaea archaeon]